MKAIANAPEIKPQFKEEAGKGPGDLLMYESCTFWAYLVRECAMEASYFLEWPSLEGRL